MFIPEGDCDCDGRRLDALGVCGGDCAADADADGICDDVDNAWVRTTSAASATVLARSTSADALTSQKETATATETSSTHLVCGGDCAADADADGICDDVDDCVGRTTSAASATVITIYECGCSDIPEGDCDCDGNQLDALAYAAVTAQRTPMPMASVTMWTTAWVRTTSAASATVLARSTSADVLTFQKETATATETSSTRLAYAAVTAQRTPMPILRRRGRLLVLDECGICNGPGAI